MTHIIKKLKLISNSTIILTIDNVQRGGDTSTLGDLLITGDKFLSNLQTLGDIRRGQAEGIGCGGGCPARLRFHHRTVVLTDS